MTAIDTIMRMQMPVCEGRFRDLCKFEAVVWVCVMAAARLGLNVNDSRFPDYRPHARS